MKKLILSSITLAVITAASIAPANAINAHYRDQLIRSGCTQVNAGTTCDIHKTKAQNAAAAKPKANDGHAARLSAMGEDLLGENASTAAAALKAAGFQQTDPGIWYNSATNDVVKTITKKGVIISVTINK